MTRLLLMASMLGAVQTAPVPIPCPLEAVTILDGDMTALDSAVHDLCRRHVALIGEAPTHGDGHTAAFKVALVRELITRCHFNAVIFESSRYEFLAFQRALRLGTAEPSMIADAVGGLWRFDREFQPLVSFLYTQAKAGRVRLAGMDSRIGGLGETFTNERMIAELTRPLPPEEARTCGTAFARHISWNYTSDSPYGRTDQDRLLACATAIRKALNAGKKADQATRIERNAMLDNIEWSITASLGSGADKAAARERWMFRNVVSIVAALPQQPKVIVWGATVHLAKSVTAISPNDKRVTLGSLLHDRYADKAFTLGFSAKSGNYRVFRKRLPIDTPPPSALENRVFAQGSKSAVYLNRRRLRRLGLLPGGALEHAYHIADWAGVLDGMVVFSEEWPTHSTRPGYF